ncbi:MAG TPA: hypothetical protein VGB64_03560 [Actinomycetota bacterium]
MTGRTLGLAAIVALVAGVGCGRGTAPQVAVSESPSPDETTSHSPSDSDSWNRYQDPEYGFSIEYPSDFVVEDVTQPRSGVRKFVRFVDHSFLGGYPAGQVEINVFEKDNEALSAWVATHSADRDAPDGDRLYYREVTNKRSTDVNGRTALAFEGHADEIGTIHHVILFLRDVVIDLAWFADDPKYEPTILPTFDRMVSTYQD